MKKHLLTFLTLAVALCFGTFQANAQGANYVSCDCPAGVSAGLPMGPADPMFILGSSVADDIAATAIPTSAETNTTDYALVVANSTDSLVLGLANANGGYDFSESPEGSYWFVGFAYNQSELVTIATTLDALPAAFLAAQLGLPVATVEAIQAAIDPATVDLADFFVLLDQLSTSPLSINSLVGSLNGIACGGTAGSVISACFATSEVPAYSIEVVAGGGGCAADAGTPVEPLGVYCQDTNNPSDLQITEYAVPPSGVPNIEYVFMQNDTNIVAVSEWAYGGINTAFGGFDPETVAPGTYTVVGFAFDQAEVDAITNNPTVQFLIAGVEGGESLAELLDILAGSSIPGFGVIPDPVSINLVASVLSNPTLGGVIGFTPCFNISSYTFNITIDDV